MKKIELRQQLSDVQTAITASFRAHWTLYERLTTLADSLGMRDVFREDSEDVCNTPKKKKRPLHHRD